MEARNIERLSISSVQYLLYRMSFREELLHPEKIFTYKNNYSRWIIKQMLIQMEKQQDKNNLNNNNNNDDSITNNKNNFTN